MAKHNVHVINQNISAGNLSSAIRSEFIRKSIHLSIALTPSIANFMGVQSTMLMLLSGILLYTAAEYSRLAGVRVPLISRLTEMSMRSRDQDTFVLGPVTLGLGALFALLFYPEPVASIAIYSLAFGDGLSSLVGKLFGTIRIPFTGGKSLEGSLTCFIAVLVSGMAFVPGLSMLHLLVIAIVATVLEALPTRDLDNIILPVGTGLIAYAFI